MHSLLDIHQTPTTPLYDTRISNCLKIQLYLLQINQQNRKETEDQIRCALQSLMKPEEVEDELRKAIEGTVY